MELKQLRRFLMIVERGSLSAAAAPLGLTQQALGAGIAKLEEDMGVLLFDRGPGGATTLTPYGTLLIRHAKHMLAAADRAREELLAFRDARGGSVSIGIGEAFAHEVIADAVRACHRARPEIRLSIIEGYSEVLKERLVEGEIDFIAGADSAAANEDVERTNGGDIRGLRLERFPLYTADDIVIARPQHPLAGKKKLTLRQMRDFTWMAPRSRPADAAVIVEAFRRQDLDPPARFIWTDAANVGMELLLSDDFLFMTSPAMVAGGLKSGSIVALHTTVPSVQRRVGLVYRSDTKLNPSAMMMMDDIRERVHLHIHELSYAVALNPGRRVSAA